MTESIGIKRLKLINENEEIDVAEFKNNLHRFMKMIDELTRRQEGCTSNSDHNLATEKCKSLENIKNMDLKKVCQRVIYQIIDIIQSFGDHQKSLKFKTIEEELQRRHGKDLKFNNTLSKKPTIRRSNDDAYEKVWENALNYLKNFMNAYIPGLSTTTEPTTTLSTTQSLPIMILDWFSNAFKEKAELFDFRIDNNFTTMRQPSYTRKRHKNRAKKTKKTTSYFTTILNDDMRAHTKDYGLRSKIEESFARVPTHEQQSFNNNSEVISNRAQMTENIRTTGILENVEQVKQEKQNTRIEVLAATEIFDETTEGQIPLQKDKHSMAVDQSKNEHNSTERSEEENKRDRLPDSFKDHLSISHKSSSEEDTAKSIYNKKSSTEQSSYNDDDDNSAKSMNWKKRLLDKKWDKWKTRYDIIQRSKEKFKKRKLRFQKLGRSGHSSEEDGSNKSKNESPTENNPNLDSSLDSLIDTSKNNSAAEIINGNNVKRRRVFIDSTDLKKQQPKINETVIEEFHFTVDVIKSKEQMWFPKIKLNNLANQKAARGQRRIQESTWNRQ